MAKISTRLTNTGTLYINGVLDEITQTTISTKADTVLASNFDEVSIAGSEVAKRDSANGSVQISGIFDEFTGAPVVDSSLLWWTDATQTASYPGSGSGVRNLANTVQTGTISGNVTFSQIDGGKFSFNNHLDITNSISAGNIGYPTSFADPWTAEAWVYVPSSATWSLNNNRSPLYYRGSYAGGHGLFRSALNNQIGVVIRGNTTAQAERVGTITRNSWNQVVGVWTGGPGGTGNLLCYINGNLVSAGVTTQNDPLDQTFWVIGGTGWISNAAGAVFVGNISSTKLYNRALTADEVAQNFNALRRRYNI